MEKKVVLASVIIFFLMLAITSNKLLIINEDKLKSDYYELVVAISELFKDHKLKGEQYYNRSFQSKEEIADLLNDKVTDAGFNLVIDTLFEENENMYVYRQGYQEYLSDTYNFSSKSTNRSYYNTVKDSFLNPALRLINFDELDVQRFDDKIVLQGDAILVNFYNEEEREIKYHQYARYGYPPQDYISLALTFVYENGNYLMDHFSVKSIEM